MKREDISRENGGETQETRVLAPLPGAICWGLCLISCAMSFVFLPFVLHNFMLVLSWRASTQS